MKIWGPRIITLVPFASLTLTHLNISSKYTSKPVDLSKFIDLVSKEANCMKACQVLKDQSSKGKTGSQTNEALAVTDGNTRRCKGNCHHCNKPGHWACKCHTQKREEDVAKAAADQSSQGAQANLGTTTKPVNKPVGSANTAIIDKYDLDDRGFWAIEEEEVHACHAELDHWMDDLDSDDEDDSYDKWEAFCTDTWGAEDAGNLDWAGLDVQLAKEGEKQDTKEEAGAAMLLTDSTPRTRPQLVPHNAPHAHTITNISEPHWALGEEGHMPHNGDGHLRTTSSYGEQVTDTMRHVHRPHDLVHSLESAHPDNPMPAICACGGQSPGFNANTQAHQAPWLGPGMTTKEQDVLLASAALLEGEEKRMLIGSSKQAAMLTTPSTSNPPLSPTTPFQSTPAAPGQAQNPLIPSVQLCGSSHIHSLAHHMQPEPSAQW
jgi:hypothetical protein